MTPWRTIIHAFEGGLKRRKTFRYLAELERSQWLSSGELAAKQFGALQRLVTYAARHCPYYREAWSRAGLTPEALTTRDAFQRWPVIDRDVIRAHRTAMRSTEPGMRVQSKATGGSTGTPLQFDLNPDSADRRVAASFRGYGWASAGPGTKQLYLWGGAVGTPPAWRRMKAEWYDRLYRRRTVNCFHVRPDRPEAFVDALVSYRPDVIVAYTNPLYEVARALEGAGTTPYAPRSIVVGAEKLHDFQREVIERVFRAPVFETYGSREFMLIGAECDRHHGLHMTVEQLMVEVLDDHGQPAAPGTEGDIAITDLFNYGMPFIRYINGDRAVAGFETCPCGRGLPLLQKVVGRRLDVLSTPDGRLVAGEFFPHLLKEFGAIRRFQVVQHAPDDIRLQMVVSGTWLPEDEARLRREVEAVLGTRGRFSITVVDDIPLTGTGKHRVVVNLCPPPPAGRP